MATQNQRLRTLVEGLYLSTDSGKISWEAGWSNDIYSTEIANYKIEITSESGARGGEDIRLNIYNEEATLIDSFTDTIFLEQNPRNTEFANYYLLMSNLYDSARRSASGSLKALDVIISEIGAPKVTDDEDIPF